MNPQCRRHEVGAAVAIFAAIASTSAIAQPLPRLEAGQSLGIALDIASVPNLRDIGGYRTGNGSAVVRGLVYRSDTLNPIDASELGRLARLKLANDFDLRTTAEATARPDMLPPGVDYVLLNVLADARSSAPAELEELLRDPREANRLLGDGKIEEMFIQAYREFVSLPSARESYRTLFEALADRRKLPAVFHCTTGKDRTGWAAAALLTLLGVPMEAVIADFMRSNDYVLPRYQSLIDRFAAAGGDRSIPLAVFGVKLDYLQASFDEMRKQYGTIEKYFSEGLGIDAAGQQALRDVYLATSP